MKSAIMIMLGLVMMGYIDIGDTVDTVDTLIPTMREDMTNFTTKYYEKMSETKMESFAVKMNMIDKFDKLIRDAINEIEASVDTAKAKGKDRAHCGNTGRTELAKAAKNIFTALIKYHGNKFNQQPYNDAIISGTDFIIHISSGIIKTWNVVDAVFKIPREKFILANTSIESFYVDTIKAVKDDAEKRVNSLGKKINTIKSKAEKCTLKR